MTAQTYAVTGRLAPGYGHRVEVFSINRSPDHLFSEVP